MSDTLARAELRRRGSSTAAVEIQFNPSTLRTTFTNQFGDDPPQSHARVTTAKLDVELIFDTTDTGESVYRYLNQLEQVTRSSASSEGQQPNGIVPIVEFWWSIKLFEGIVESVTQTIDYWSHDGVPLRATVQLALKETNHGRDGIEVKTASRRSAEININDQADDTAAIAEPVSPKGTTDVATKAGNSRAGRTVAAQNGLESMRGGAAAGASASAGAGAFAAAGASASAGAFAGASASAGASAGASASAGLAVSAGAKLGAAASFQMSGGVSASAGAGASLGFGLGASAGASASAGIGAAAGIGLSGGAAIGGGAGIGIGGGVGIGAGAGISAGAGIGVGASAGAGVAVGASAGAFAGVKGSASAGVSASAGAFAGLGSSKMITGNTGMDISRLLPPPMPAPMGNSAQFDATGKLVNDGSVVVASSYTTQTTDIEGNTTRTSSSSVRVM